MHLCNFPLLCILKLNRRLLRQVYGRVIQELVRVHKMPKSIFCYNTSMKPLKFCCHLPKRRPLSQIQKVMAEIQKVIGLGYGS